MVMQRELIRWLQSLDLTYPVRHPQQDLSNGFTFAEIASRHDQRVAMHSYVPGCSSECKRRNWKVLLRDLRRIECDVVTAEMAEGTMQGKPGMALHVLEVIYAFFCGRPIPQSTLQKRVQSPMGLLLNKLDVTHSQKKCKEGLAQGRSNIPQPLTIEDDGSSFVKELRQPGFARTTVAALLHVANNDTRNAMLVSAIPGDELQIQLRNERLLNERKVFNKAYRHAEPERFAVIPRFRNIKPTKKPALKGLSGRTGAMGENDVAVDKVSVVAVNSMNMQLVSAIRAHGGLGNNAKARNAEELHDCEARELLESCGNNLCLGLSKILSLVLESIDLKNNKQLEELSTEGSAHDMLSAFVGRREELPFVTLSACWSALLDASGGIASALSSYPTEYLYLLHVFQFAFSADVAHIRTLHVSGPPKNEETLGEKVKNTSKNLSGNYRFSQNTFGFESMFQSVKNDSADLPQVLFLNECAYNVASVFSLLCSIGAALHKISPSLSLSLVKNYFLPTASRLFSLASAAILEAIARVVVSHVCGSVFNRRDKLTVESSLDEEKEQSQINEEEKDDELTLLENQKEQDVRQMYLLLTGPIKKAFFQSDPTMTDSALQLRFQYNLFFYHVLRHMRFVFGDVNIEKKHLEQDDNLSLQLCKSMTTATPTISSTNNSSTLMELCYEIIFISLGSSFMHERSVGVAMLLQLLACDRWDLLIDPLLFILNDIRERGMSSGFLRRNADAWEIRLLLLELLTTAFRKALYVLAENFEETSFCSKLTANESSTTEYTSSATASLIRGKFDFGLIEDATVMCLIVFLEAPILQRQMALQVVGARLLPDEQRRVAAIWLRCLFSCPVEQLDFLLCPYERNQPHLDLSRHTSASQQHKNHTKRNILSRTPSSSRLKSRSKQNRSSMLEAAKNATLLYLSKRITGSLDEVVSSVRAIFGRVEAAYVVAPLNHSWDTFGVVHAALMFEETLTTKQLFSIILAALLSPQQCEVQQLGLLRSLCSVTNAGDSSERVGNSNSISIMLSSFVGELAEEKFEKKSGVTLQELVGACKNTNITANIKAIDDLIASVNGSEFLPSSDPITPACGVLEEKEKEKGEGVMGVEKDEKTRDEEKNSETPDTMESYEEKFWLSVSRLLRAKLHGCLTNCKSSQTRRNEKSSLAVIESDRSALSTCRIAKEEDAAQLQLLAAAMLLTLFCKVSPTFAGMSAGEDCLLRAQHWLDSM